jgi:hypothetical protein
MSVLSDLEPFIRDHQSHGALTADATKPASSGYLLTVGCPCGVVLRDGSRRMKRTLICCRSLG